MLSIYVLNATSGQPFHLEVAALNYDGTITIVYDSSNSSGDFIITLRALFRRL